MTLVSIFRLLQISLPENWYSWGPFLPASVLVLSHVRFSKVRDVMPDPNTKSSLSLEKRLECSRERRMLWWSPAWQLIEKLTCDIIIEITVTRHNCISSQVTWPAADKSWESSVRITVNWDKTCHIDPPGKWWVDHDLILSSGERRERLDDDRRPNLERSHSPGPGQMSTGGRVRLSRHKGINLHHGNSVY